MGLVREVLKDAAVGVGVADTPEDLSVINAPGVAAAVWRRTIAPSLQDWIERLDPNQLPRMRRVLRPDAVRSAVAQVCDDCGTPDCVERDLLTDDVAALSDHFAELMSAPYLRVRLDVVTTNACRKFHIDAVTARLVCTYRGAGTQYGISTDGEAPRRVFTVMTGAPILLRGTLWRGDRPSGLLHRSPPIEGSGETRLLLVLDPVFDPAEED